jgi:hypothetical protein
VSYPGEPDANKGTVPDTDDSSVLSSLVLSVLLTVLAERYTI